jgi:O-antigen/teichoic acid export membrane protein
MQPVWAVLDQGALSATNFAVAVAAAHVTATREFGAYGIVVTSYSLAITVSRAFVVMPFLMSMTDARDDLTRASWRRQGLATAVVVGVAMLLLLLCAGILVGGLLGDWLVVLSLVAPLLILQDCARYVVFTSRGSGALFAMDTAWLVLNVTLQLVVVKLDLPGEYCVLAWGTSSVVCLLFVRRGDWALSVWPHFKAFVSGSGIRGIELTGEAIATSGSQNIANYVIVALSGLYVAGQFRASQVLLGPAMVASQGLVLAVTPAVLAAGKQGRDHLLRAVLLLAAVLMAFAIGSAGLMYLVPQSWGEAVLAQAWVAGQELLWPVAVILALSSFATCVLLGFRGLGITRETMLARIYLFPVAPICAAVGFLLTGTAHGAAIGLVVSALAAAIALFTLFVRGWSTQDGVTSRRSRRSQRMTHSLR